MNELNPKKENVDLINRKPLAYTVGVFIILLSYFIARQALTENKRSEDCNMTIARTERRDSLLISKAQAGEKSANDKLVQYLLSKADEERLRDSIIRATVGDRAKRIIENAK